MDVYGYYTATAVIYGLLLGGVLLVGCVKKRFFPYIHLGIASICGVIYQAITVSPIITPDDYYSAMPGFVYVILVFLSIQYLAMFLIPMYVAHRHSKLIKNSKTKQKAARALVIIGYFVALVAIFLLVASLASTDTTHVYTTSAIFAYLYLVHIAIHWLLIILCFIVTLLLRKEIPNVGSFATFGFFIMLMMVGTTVNIFGNPYMRSSTAYDLFWVYIFLYHVCCYIGILICAFFGPLWIQDIKYLDTAETVA